MRSAPPTGQLGRAATAFLLVAVALVLAFTFVPPVASTVRTLALLPELIELPLRPLSALTRQPGRISTTYGSPPDRIDLYLPVDARPDAGLPAVVLALGVHPPPIDDPDVVRIAEAISRVGVVVAVPDSAALRQTRVEPSEPAHLADAVLLVAGRPEVDAARVGLAGFSAGASIAVIAAADPRIASSLDYVSAFGGYADAETLLVDVATRSMERDGTVVAWSPDAGIRTDVLALFLAVVEPESVRQELRALLADVVAAEQPPSGPDPRVAAALTDDALAAYQLFTATDRSSARAAIDQATPALREQLGAISPLAFARSIEAPVYLMHGEGDRAIPISHAVALNAHLRNVARLTRFGRFEHGQPGEAGLGLEDVPDIWQLTLHLHALVAAATE